MAISEVLSLITPPANPLDGEDADAAWAVERFLGSSLPTDYVELARRYGTGCFGDPTYYFWIDNPLRPGSADLTPELKAAAEAAWAAGAAAARTGFEASVRAAVSVVAEHDPTGNGIWDTAWDLVPDETEHSALRTAAGKQVLFLRDIFGNLFRPVVVDPAMQRPRPGEC